MKRTVVDKKALKGSITPTSKGWYRQVLATGIKICWHLGSREGLRFVRTNARLPDLSSNNLLTLLVQTCPQSKFYPNLKTIKLLLSFSLPHLEGSVTSKVFLLTKDGFLLRLGELERRAALFHLHECLKQTANPVFHQEDLPLTPENQVFSFYFFDFLGKRKATQKTTNSRTQRIHFWEKQSAPKEVFSRE